MQTLLTWSGMVLAGTWAGGTGFDGRLGSADVFSVSILLSW